MSSNNRAYRSSQLISPFGPGCIIELGEESLILVDPQLWPKKLEEIKLDRLTKEVGVWALKKPPVIKGISEKLTKDNSLMAVRFPKWMFCPRCRKLELWRKDIGKTNYDGVPVCSNEKCKDKVLVPMRFVAACEHGHLRDVPWNIWAHRNSKESCSSPELYFKSSPEKGSGLDALYIECTNPNCGAKNDLKNLMSKGALAGIKCYGNQPWEYDNKECSEELKVLQRGASNLYYSIIRSALDIPYDEVSVGNPTYDLIKKSQDFEDLLRAIDQNSDRKIQKFAEWIAEEFGLTEQEVIRAATSQEKEQRTFKIPQDKDLRIAEWDILSSTNIEQKKSKTFKAERLEWNTPITFGFEKIIDKVVLLHKLREVRAFCGFERISPSDNIVKPESAQQSSSWLPATEVYGEGIFLQFDQTYLDDWESNLSIEMKKRIEDFLNRHANASSNYLPIPTAKFLVLHTFSHLLIRQLSFESGYSSGSLRERIYADEGQAGLLIYTADGDSEGSLGGLVQQGKLKTLLPLILATLENSHWCSNDPICSEMEAQGVMSLNKAACHSCTLVSETSCEHNNLLLDRKILIDEEGKGFFSQILMKARELD
ncbi:DrmB family protein [Acinetobacter indicus]|uniref:DrmB family protein n=1 Tax=Acinetobacter indicus TaxID=756892 RepID=UPI00398A1A6A